MDPDILALDPLTFFICKEAVLLGVVFDDAAERTAVIAFDAPLALHVGLAGHDVDLHRRFCIKRWSHQQRSGKKKRAVKCL
tara:strand:+ start:376 stop:618 length:243 start_codon:yes stop_codon:yes gene_type:complete